jgi:hypothetical protein
MKAYGGVDIYVHIFLTSVLDGGKCEILLKTHIHHLLYKLYCKMSDDHIIPKSKYVTV